jgi:hypothetical protein
LTKGPHIREGYNQSTKKPEQMLKQDNITSTCWQEKTGIEIAIG